MSFLERKQTDLLLKKSYAIGSQALIKFMQAMLCRNGPQNALCIYGTRANAPKIMSKIEINDLGRSIESKSDGVHLLAMNDNFKLFHQLNWSIRCSWRFSHSD